jgi:hypothetical protein
MMMLGQYRSGLALKVGFDERTLVNFVRRCRERWNDFEVTRVVIKRTKQILFVRVQGYMVKLIVHNDGRVQAFSRAQGLAYAVKKIALRVLGLEEKTE